MIKTYLRLAGLGILALLILAAALAFVFQLGPFNHRPSAAAKALPKTEKVVAKTQAAEVKAVTKAEDHTQTAAAAIEKRTANGVAAIRKSAARPAPPGVVYADVPDAEFYLSVCKSKLYVGDPACDSRGR